MGIMDTLFGSSKAAEPAGGTQQTAPAATTTATQTQGTDPATQQQAATTPNSPLDQFSAAWQNDDTKKAAEQVGIFGDVNPKDIADAASKVNFLSQVSKEDIQAVQAGGEDATKALAAILQKVTQAGYAQSALASTKLIDQAAAQLEQKLLGKMPEQVRRSMVDTTLQEQEAAFSHPAVAPVVDLVKNQLLQKYPTATAAEISKMATSYFTEALVPALTKQPAPSASQTAEDFDWAGFLAQ